MVIEKTVGNCLGCLPSPPSFRTRPSSTWCGTGVDVRVHSPAVDRVADRRYLLGKAWHFPLRLAPRYGAKYLRSLARRRVHGDGRVGSWGPRYPGIDDDLRRQDLLVVCARQWRASVEYATRDLARVSTPVIDVRYEQLVWSR